MRAASLAWRRFRRTCSSTATSCSAYWGSSTTCWSAARSIPPWPSPNTWRMRGSGFGPVMSSYTSSSVTSIPSWSIARSTSALSTSASNTWSSIWAWSVFEIGIPCCWYAWTCCWTALLNSWPSMAMPSTVPIVRPSRPIPTVSNAPES